MQSTHPTTSRPRRNPLETVRRAEHIAAALESERARTRATRLLTRAS